LSDRVLIVNADDFGRSPGVNGGVMRCHRDGIVSSATLMVRWPAAEDAAAYASRETLGVGLHVDLGEWEYRDGAWRTVYEVVALDDAAAVAAEVGRQVERFERLVGRMPDHLDSHQHVHRDEPARSAVLEQAARLGIPVREATPGIAYTGAFFGQDGRGEPVPEAITVEALVGLIEALPPGVTELACHPAAAVDHPSVYATERLAETEALCDPRVREGLERSGIELRSFADLAGHDAHW
jgi:predicted glycoside hydrolase/deacetylase ChbG (UPF0249 family)